MYSLMYLISAVVSYVCAGNYAVYTYMHCIMYILLCVWAHDG